MRNDMYMITCSARTGSSLLETSLMSHPDVMGHGEIYAIDKIGALRGHFTDLVLDEAQNAALTTWRDRHQTAFLYKYVYDAQGRKMVGHKLKHEELMLPKFAETREAVRRDTDIRIIHLRRNNLFERFVSHWLATRVTGVTEIHSEEARPELNRVSLPVREAHINFDRTSARYNFFAKMFRHHRVFEVAYEDLAGTRREETLAQIQTFLGLEPHVLESRLKKVVNKDYRQLVENYDELAAHFADTPYSSFFQEA